MGKLVSTDTEFFHIVKLHFNTANRLDSLRQMYDADICFNLAS